MFILPTLWFDIKLLRFSDIFRCKKLCSVPDELPILTFQKACFIIGCFIDILFNDHSVSLKTFCLLQKYLSMFEIRKKRDGIVVLNILQVHNENTQSILNTRNRTI